MATQRLGSARFWQQERQQQERQPVWRQLPSWERQLSSVRLSSVPVWRRPVPAQPLEQLPVWRLL
jgi:negative regulator of sigma E activity